MADFFERRDIQNVVAFTDADSLFEFGFESPEQLVFNIAGSEELEVSWDGENVHGILAASGPTSAISWEDHVRSRVWVRRTGGPGGGVLNVEVYAVTR